MTNRRGKKVSVPGYGAWADMKQRCNNKNLRSYPLYGGRGISYCERWESFDNFIEDMGVKPTGMTLDRIDSNSNYSPENCRWATPREQALNTSRNRRILFNGKNQTATEWAAELGISPITLFGRIRRGWELSDALGRKVLTKGNKSL